jgi:hypothetical protein
MGFYERVIAEALGDRSKQHGEHGQFPPASVLEDGTQVSSCPEVSG